MSIEIDWEVTEAPPEGDPGAGRPTRQASQPNPGAGGTPRGEQSPDSANTRQWRGWGAVLILIVLGIGLGAWLVTRLGWQRVTGEVAAMVRYEDELALAGNRDLLLNFQDATNADWLVVRSAEVASHLAAPLPAPQLAAETEPAEVAEVVPLTPDLVRAEVYREYTSPSGETLRFRLPQYYLRQGPSDWARTAFPANQWGEWLDWAGQHVRIRHSEQDANLVAELGPRLEKVLAEACGLWRSVCTGRPPAKLYLSSYVGALRYDPLANVEVQVQFGPPGTPGVLPPDYFVSVPSPQLAGVPADAAALEYLADYLAVRLIAAVAFKAEPDDAARNLIDAAIDGLGLNHADPGFAQAQQPVTAQAAPAAEDSTSAPAPTSVPIARAGSGRVLATYTIQPGDTLLAIAERYGVRLDRLAGANGIDDPDFIQAGSILIIPAGE